MYCEKCGKKINPEDKFCGSCGTAINSIQEPKENVFEAKNEEMNKNGETNRFEAKDVELNKVKGIVDKVSDSPTSAIHPSLLNDTSKESQLLKAQAKGLGMKWYKFLIYFSLFFSALSCLFNFVILFTGSHYDMIYRILYGEGVKGSELIYQTYPAIRYVNYLFGVLFFILAFYALIMRSRLAKFKKNATSQYIAFLFAVFIVDTFYIFSSAFILESVDITIANGLLVTGGKLLLEKTYFSKREHLFVN